MRTSPWLARQSDSMQPQTFLHTLAGCLSPEALWHSMGGAAAHTWGLQAGRMRGAGLHAALTQDQDDCTEACFLMSRGEGVDKAHPDAPEHLPHWLMAADRRPSLGGCWCQAGGGAACTHVQCASTHISSRPCKAAHFRARCNSSPWPLSQSGPPDGVRHLQLNMLDCILKSHLSHVHRRTLADGAEQSLTCLLPDCCPMGPQIVYELCDFDLWQAASGQDHVMANIPQCSHQAGHIAKAQIPHSQMHSIQGNLLMQP